MDVNKSGRLLAGRIASPRWKGNTDPRSTSGANYSLGWQRRRRPTWKRCRVKDDNRRDSLTSSGG